jgi:hypothetical protein
MRLPLVAAILLLAPEAGIPWPKFSWNKEESKSIGTHCTQPSAETRTILGLRIGQDAIESAEKVFGPSPLHQRGDAGDALEWRCWEAANGDGNTLWLGAGEVYEELRIFGPEIAFPERGTCPKSKLVHAGLSTASGLRLGLTRQAIEKQVGAASKAGKGWYAGTCDTETQMTKDEIAHLIATGLARSTDDDFSTTSSSDYVVIEKEGKAIGIEITWLEVW